MSSVLIFRPLIVSCFSNNTKVQTAAAAVDRCGVFLYRNKFHIVQRKSTETYQRISIVELGALLQDEFSSGIFHHIEIGRIKRERDSELERDEGTEWKHPKITPDKYIMSSV